MSAGIVLFDGVVGVGANALHLRVGRDFDNGRFPISLEIDDVAWDLTLHEAIGMARAADTINYRVRRALERRIKPTPCTYRRDIDFGEDYKLPFEFGVGAEGVMYIRVGERRAEAPLDQYQSMFTAFDRIGDGASDLRRAGNSPPRVLTDRERFGW